MEELGLRDVNDIDKSVTTTWYTPDITTLMATDDDYPDCWYLVKLSWFDDDHEYQDRGDVNYIFSVLEDAVHFAYDLAYTEIGKLYNNPVDVYVFKVPAVQVATMSKTGALRHREDDGYLFAYQGCNEYIKTGEVL